MLFSKYSGGFYDPAINHEIPADAVEVGQEEHASLMMAQAAGKSIVADADGRPIAIDPSPPTVEERQRALIDAVQRHMDAGAQARGYDGILSATSYATSTHPTFGPEGIAFRDWRDTVWAYCHQVRSEVEAGRRAMPEAEDLIAELPVAKLP